MREKIKKCACAVFRIWFQIPFAICNRLSSRLALGPLLRGVCEAVEAVTPYYFTYNLRPKRADMVVSREGRSPNASKFAIIMQGPLLPRDDFTLETVKLYEKLFPGVEIIVSTWEDEDRAYVERIQNETSARVVLNKAPQSSGLMNFNMQEVSTLGGLKAAAEDGKEFAFKSRCDYRFYKKGMLEYMHNLLLDYPVVHDDLGQKYRIAMTSGRNDDMFRPFYVGDQFQFGHIEDLTHLWDTGLARRQCSAREFQSFCKKRKLSWKQERAYTSLFTRQYVKKRTGRDLDISVKAYWEYARDHLIFLSAKDMDAYWNKYESRYEETLENGEFYRDDTTEKLLGYNWNFALWNNLYHESLEYDEDMEKISERVTW